MTQQIDIQAIPNQSLSCQLDGSRYDITLKITAGVMSATIVRDGATIVQGQRLASGEPIIPYFYLENGNFTITTLNGDLVDYDQFGVTQFLIYASAAELATFHAEG